MTLKIPALLCIPLLVDSDSSVQTAITEKMRFLSRLSVIPFCVLLLR
ncbi:hypothetical protein GIX45_20395 [Erwinia sp. CPCC 100877]|nr:hypothetical protein [Erwinia sp. CPCC 100877]